MDQRAASLARLFDAVGEGVYIGILETDSSETIAANPHLKLMFGYAADTPDAEIRPFDPERFLDRDARRAFTERLGTDGAVRDFPLQLRRAGDQASMWVEVTAAADRLGANGPLHVEALVRDVSERRKIDDETRDLHHQALQAEKMAALGQTISGVAHELNNPIASILNWAERLSAKTTLDESVRRGLDTIVSESERAARIVRSLLTFARKRQTARATVDINQVVRETLALRAYEQHASNVATIDALAAGLPPVFADGRQIQQLLLNLLINAEQAMLDAHGRGLIVIRTWHSLEEDAVIIELNDDGPGVPEKWQSKIFEPFFTTKALGKGTGLGLTVAYAIVEEHGGRIRIESRPDAGVSFFVELPISGQKPAALVPSERSADPIDEVSGRAVLLVDDEAALAAAVAEALRSAGYSVQYAADGEEALTKAAAVTFDVVICDLRMPRMDGPAFFRALMLASPLLAKRVIFVTGDIAGTDAESFLGQSGCRWLAKPFRLADLLRTVKEVLA